MIEIHLRREGRLAEIGEEEPDCKLSYRRSCFQGSTQSTYADTFNDSFVRLLQVRAR